MIFNVPFSARYGLSENELQSLLSCDEEVLKEVYQYHTPPVRILPPLLFVRLKKDVDKYLGDYNILSKVLDIYLKII